MQASREMERYARAQQRAQQQAVRAQERATRDQQRAQAAAQRAAAANQKEQARLYALSRADSVQELNAELAQFIEDLKSLLSHALEIDSYLNLDSLKTQPDIKPFAPGSLAVPEKAPLLENFLPAPLAGLNQFLPWAKKEWEAKEVEARRKHRDEVEKHHNREALRCAKLREAKELHAAEVLKIQQEAALQHAEIDTLKTNLKNAVPDAIQNYFELILDNSDYPDEFPQSFKTTFNAASKYLVVDYDVPAFDIVPEVSSYKYVKTHDEITESKRSMTQRRELYISVLAQLALRTLHELFEADHDSHLAVVIFNGYVDAINPGTGQQEHSCLITVRSTRPTFKQLDLSRVEPMACLKTLGAAISKNPIELVSVRPLSESSMEAYPPSDTTGNTQGECPACGSRRSLQAKHCGVCGSKLPWAQ